jgi:hypothetical protein
MRNGYKFLVDRPESKIYLGRSRRSWKESAKMDFKEAVRLWTGFIGLRTATDEYGDELSGSINDGEFLDWL